MDWLAQEQWIQAVIAPQAATLDQDSQALAAAFQLLGDRHLLALKVLGPATDLPWDSQTFWQFQRALARASGALAFLQVQHQSASTFLSESPNHPLTQPLLPQMADGRVRVGVAFSHLRHPESLQASPQTEGWCLTGQVPWATGFRLFDYWVVGAHLPDQQMLLCLLPFQDQVLAAGSLTLSHPLPLAALGVTQTVSAQFQQFPITPEQVLAIHPATWLQERDRRSVLAPTAGLMGCAQAALDHIQPNDADAGAVATRAWQALSQTWHLLSHQIQSQLALASWNDDAALNLRAQAVSLAFDSTRTAVVACGGAANSLSHPAQRLYREALAWAVLGQTMSVRQACLAKE